MRRFTLLDEVYYDALRQVTGALEREGLPFCLVGGGAAQAWIASLRTEGGARRLAEERVLETALRKTRDLDFATRADLARMTALLNSLAASTGAGAHVVGPRALRLGPVSVSLTLGPGDLSGMADLYDRFLASRTVLRLRRGNTVDEVPTIGIEALVATKLTRRGDKAKDILDVVELLAAARDAGRHVDLTAMRGFVGDRPEALSLLEEAERRTREEP